MMIKNIPHQTIPLALLMEADPSKERVLSYLSDAMCFGIEFNDTLVAAAVLKEVHQGKFSLMNIAVSPEHQKKGLGTALLSHILDWVAKCGGTCIEVGTGSFGHQLSFYQRAGFRVTDIEKNHFLDHYPSPLLENGIQHKDRLILQCHF